MGFMGLGLRAESSGPELGALETTEIEKEALEFLIFLGFICAKFRV